MSGRDHARSMTVWRVPLALACLLTLAMTTLWSPPSARAEDPPAPLSVTLTSFTPALPKRTDTITVSGTVTNVSDKPAYLLEAFFWNDHTPITNGEGLQGALQSAPTVPEGGRVTDANFNPPDPTKQSLLPPGAGLNPGKSLTFSFSTPVSALELPEQDGVYLMGVQIRGDQDGTASNRFTMGRARVFVPMVSKQPTNTIKLASIVMLSQPPSLLRRGDKLFSNESLAAAVGDGGRLDKLLTAASQPGNSFAVDPNLIEELQVMSSGYQVAAESAKPTTGAGTAAAEAWLNRFAEIAKSSDGYRLPYAMSDLAAVTHRDQANWIGRAEQASQRVSMVAALPLLVMPSGGYADAATIAQAAALDPAAIVVSDATVGGQGPLLTGPGAAPIISYTTSSFAGGPGPDPRTTPIHLRQGVLADSWIQAATAPPGTTLGSVRVISTPNQAVGETEAELAPWMQRVTLSELLKGSRGPLPAKFNYPNRAGGLELSPQLLDEVASLDKSFQTYTELLVDADQASAESDAAIARATSAWWRGNEDDDRAFIAAQREQLDNILTGNRIRLVAAEKIILSGSSAVFPVTVTNDLDVDIKIRLEFDSANAQRLRIPPFPAEHGKTEVVPAKESRAFNIPTRATSNGTVTVSGHVTTASGARIGRARKVDVTATELGTAGILIAVGAGIVLIGASAFRIRQVARERAKA